MYFTQHIKNRGGESTVISWNIQTQMLSLLVVFLGAIIFVIAFNIKLKKQDPLKSSKGIVWVAETFVKWIDGNVLSTLPKTWKKTFAPYMGALVWIIFFGTIIGITGLPAATTTFSLTLSLALVSFLMIHITAIRKTKFAYFKRFVQPFPFFLPVNLLSMWAPLISLSVRLFANVLSGTIIVALIYSGLSGILGGVLTPLVAPIFHGYFDLFAGAIQSLVFMLLTLLLIQQEIPEEEQALIGQN